jgi:hypothetical protein
MKPCNPVPDKAFIQHRAFICLRAMLIRTIDTNVIRLPVMRRIMNRGVKPKFTLLCIVLLQVAAGASGGEAMTDKIYQSNIRTVQLYVDPLVLSDPVIPLRAGTTLRLAFDDLDGGKKYYYYTIVQCNYDWTVSELSPFDYLNGIQEQDIQDYQFSFNTSQPYTHYEVVFPNRSIGITKSGNYIVKVYLDGDPQQVVLVRRFIVFEGLAEIYSEIRVAEDVTLHRSHQQVNFSVSYRGLPVSNPFSEIQVAILQNYRWDNMITGVTPQFMKPEMLEYYYTAKTSFPAGKEFRYFDIRTTRYQTDRVKAITELDHSFLFTLFSDDVRSNQPYLYRQDVNGKFIPGTLDYFNQEAQSEYTWVKVTLPVDYPIRGGKIFIVGKFTDWQLWPDFELHFNDATSAYEATLYLKEGYYEYRYSFVTEGDFADADLLEGNDYETENTYQIFVYFRPFGARYDQVIAYKVTDSFNR